MDPDLGVDPDPPWIRIHMIPIPALLDVIPAPDPDPQKSGVVTPLIIMYYRAFCQHHGNELRSYFDICRARARRAVE